MVSARYREVRQVWVQMNHALASGTGMGRACGGHMAWNAWAMWPLGLFRGVRSLRAGHLSIRLPSWRIRAIVQLLTGDRGLSTVHQHILLTCTRDPLLGICLISYNGVALGDRFANHHSTVLA